MGRKKIEIRPLTDERNRNVTFLKRKAGLMKKAWELSVLCGADVSLLIFSAAGKAYEFSSSDLDREIDRYLDYEGMIERRRAAEFAAMAAAGEDDEDEEEDELDSRRGSMTANKSGQPAAPKSLKGKETFKARHTTREDVSRAARNPKDRRDKRGSRDKGKGESSRSRGRDSRKGRSFIDGLLYDERGSDSEDEAGRAGSSTEPTLDEYHDRGGDMNNTNLQYAMGLYGTQPSSQAYPPPQPHYEAYGSSHTSHSHPLGGLPPTATNFRVQHANQLDPSHYNNPSSGTGPFPFSNYLSSLAGQPPPSAASLPTPPGGSSSAGGGAGQPLIPPNMQWDPALLARYAEFHLTQAHQRQQRALLERQRQQLAELGVPLDDRSLLDELFSGPGGGVSGGAGSGGGGGGGGSMASGTMAGASMTPSASAPAIHTSLPPIGGSSLSDPQDHFVWPVTRGNGGGGSGVPGTTSMASTPGPGLQAQDDMSWSFGLGMGEGVDEMKVHSGGGGGHHQHGMGTHGGHGGHQMHHLPSPASAGDRMGQEVFAGLGGGGGGAGGRRKSGRDGREDKEPKRQRS